MMVAFEPRPVCLHAQVHISLHENLCSQQPLAHSHISQFPPGPSEHVASNLTQLLIHFQEPCVNISMASICGYFKQMYFKKKKSHKFLSLSVKQVTLHLISPKWYLNYHRRKTQRERLADARPMMAKGALIFINYKYQMGKKKKQNPFL